MRTAIKFVGIYIGLSLVLGLMWVVASYPHIPSTSSEWLWVLVLALPLQLAGEFLGELLRENRVTRFVEQRTAAKSLSVVRIFYLLLLFLLCAGLLLAASYGWSEFQSLLGRA